MGRKETKRIVAVQEPAKAGTPTGGAPTSPVRDRPGAVLRSPGNGEQLTMPSPSVTTFLFLGRLMLPSILWLGICGCESPTSTAGGEPPSVSKGTGEPAAGREVSRMQLTGPFENGATIDKRHTGEGQDISPSLKWSGAPTGTKSFALVCDDPDAPSPRRPGPTPWVHWVMFNIPATATELPAGIPRDAEPQEVAGSRQGRNSWERDNFGYRGPLPPPSSGAHRYVFRLYALDTQLDLDPKQTRKDSLLKAMQGHVLAQGELMGKYER